jgi:hypothetical protein
MLNGHDINRFDVLRNSQTCRVGSTKHSAHRRVLVDASFHMLKCRPLVVISFDRVMPHGLRVWGNGKLCLVDVLGFVLWWLGIGGRDPLGLLA